MARDLCTRLLCASPEHRLMPAGVLQHTWLQAAVTSDRRINLSLRYIGRVATLRGVCMRCLESVLSESYREALRSEFDALDSDCKGYLNAADVRRALKSHSSRGRSTEEEHSWTRATSGRESEEEGTDPVNTAAAASRLNISVAELMQRLLRSALEGSGVGRKHKQRRGRNSLRVAHGARRVGVVSFSMFAEAFLEGNRPLMRKMWTEAFGIIDGDGDGVIGDADLLNCLQLLDVEVSEEQRENMLAEGNSCTSKDLLRLVLKPEVPPAVTRQRKSKMPSAVAVPS
jgi:Ca2+-binding EF-hand superfamily protein